MITPKEAAIFVCLSEHRFWQPNHTKIAKHLNIPISTVWDIINRLSLSDHFTVTTTITFTPQRRDTHER